MTGDSKKPGEEAAAIGYDGRPAGFDSRPGLADPEPKPEADIAECMLCKQCTHRDRSCGDRMTSGSCGDRVTSVLVVPLDSPAACKQCMRNLSTSAVSFLLPLLLFGLITALVFHCATSPFDRCMAVKDEGITACIGIEIRLSHQNGSAAEAACERKFIKECGDLRWKYAPQLFITVASLFPDMPQSSWWNVVSAYWLGSMPLGERLGWITAFASVCRAIGSSALAFYLRCGCCRKDEHVREAQSLDGMHTSMTRANTARRRDGVYQSTQKNPRGFSYQIKNGPKSDEDPEWDANARNALEALNR